MNMRLFSVLGIVVFAASPATALNIFLYYSHDTAGDDFFGSNPLAKAAVDAAAADLEAVIGTTLSAVTNDTVEATSGSTTVGINARYTYTNPVTGATETITDTTTVGGADEFRVYVGVRPLSDTTGIGSDSTLGQGGPGGAGFSGSFSGLESELVAAVDAAAAAFNSEYTRNGPIYSTAEQQFHGGGDYGAVYVGVWTDGGEPVV
jgi:hypothetical protein